MSVEQFANNAQTTINQNGGILAGDTSVTVTSNTGFPANPSFRVVIDSEKILVTAGQGGLTWTIQRGVENTTPANHANGATVTQVLTNAGLLNAFVTKIDEAIISGTTASITFPNLISVLPTTFRDIWVVYSARDTSAGTATSNMLLQLGTGGGAVDTLGNYLTGQLYNSSATTAAYAEQVGVTSLIPGLTVNGGAPANLFMGGEFTLLNYVGATLKEITGKLGGSLSLAANGTRVQTISGLWNNTGTITSFKITPGAGSFAAGSVFSVYGLP